MKLFNHVNYWLWDPMVKVSGTSTQHLLEECVKTDSLSGEDASLLKQPYSLLNDGGPVQFLNFDDFVRLGHFPRCPDNENLICDLDRIDRDHSLMVYISHSWLRGWSGSDGWDGQPHPDNPAGDKYHLCVRGIKALHATFAPRMKKCYIWLDYCCVNQNDNPAGQVKHLDKIIHYCDCIFTPIVDHDHRTWELPTTITNLHTEYKAKLWNDGPHAFLNRAWCRLEMLYAANIPVQENTNKVTMKRHTMFDAGLAFHCRHNRRPHFLYGFKEYEVEGMIPHFLPPLQRSFLTGFNPLKGYLSVPSDKEHIEALMTDLQPYLDKHKTVWGYQGDVNSEGHAHGQGTYRYPDGSVYEGEWKNDRRHGHGSHQYADGNVYEGGWKDGLRHGTGTYLQTDGAVYVGEWCEGQMHGRGTFRYTSGDVYNGEWKDDMKHGRGTLIQKDGEMFVGKFESDVPVVTCSSLSVCCCLICCCSRVWMKWALPWYYQNRIYSAA